MNIIKVPFEPLFSDNEKVELEVTSSRLKSGALLPSDIMLDGVLAIFTLI